MFSARTSRDASQNPLAIAVARARAAGLPLLDLTVSNPTVAGIPYDAAAILGALSDPRALVYGPEPFGLPSAREVIARDLTTGGVAVDPAHVMLTASTSEAYDFLFKLLCDPGDET